ncbi:MULTISPECIES: hypothetical protein [unclassified Rhizobium]|nr:MULTISPECIES: hypothetical protein [unclassified Rhizobium]MDF0664167.1 hypothetical protein [Rhizobium sp. BC49]
MPTAQRAKPLPPPLKDVEDKVREKPMAAVAVVAAIAFVFGATR